MKQAWYLAAVAFGAANALLGGTSSKPGGDPEGLTIRTQKDHIVLHWNGPVEPPMQERFAQAFRQLELDPRRIVISLNSGGGSVRHGRMVIDEIRRASRAHQIDSLVGAGSSCASMCVPIYLAGFERYAHPAAQFMFHEASIRFSPEQNIALRTLSVNVAETRKQLANMATDELFSDDFKPQGVDPTWLAQMRIKIQNRDIWLNARQLVEQRSGVVDKLRSDKVAK
jgi:ATP-dependent protease ClpP protease subunit